jgi:hypothetical protein
VRSTRLVEVPGKAAAEPASHKPHVTNLIRRELKCGDVFLDIGAALGFFTMWASDIEPNPLNLHLHLHLQLIYASRLRNALESKIMFEFSRSAMRFSESGAPKEYSALLSGLKRCRQ